jgi:general secretion pathway protein C
MHVDAAFKRSFVPMVAVLIAAAAYFQALGMRALVAGVFSDPAVAAAPPWRRVPRSVLVGLDADHTTDAAPLLLRDPFSSSKAPAEIPAAEPVAPCASTRVVLIAASGDAWSFAAIGQGGQPPVLRRAGDQVAGYSVEAIESDGVWLVAGSTRCRAGLGAPAVAEPPPPLKKEGDSAGSAGRRRGATLPPEIAGGIRQVGERAYDVDRSAFNAILERQAELIGSLRAIPEKEGDRVVGVRLTGVRPGSLLAAIGMQNGDRLTKINGVEVGDPATMLEAYTRLRGADHLVVSVLRGGAPLNVDLHIR